MANKFTHLHLHTMYSLRDGITDPEALMKRCANNGMPNVAVTDHGNLMGAWYCAKYAKKYGINFIPGNEVYVVPDVQKCRGQEWSKGKSHHLVLLAYNQEGWENLLAITTRSNVEGYYYQPRVDYSMLRDHSAGLFAHTACLGGPTAKAFVNGSSVHLVAEMYREIFADRLSLEIQINGHEAQIPYNDALIKVSNDTGIPLVATVDSHYLEKKDSHKQDLLFCLGMDKVLDDPARHRYPAECFSVETPDEVNKKFVTRYGDTGRKAIARTMEIAENCDVNIEIETKNYKIPSVKVAEAEDYAEYIEWKSRLIGARDV